MDLRSPEVLESFSRGGVLPSVPRPLKRFYKGEPMALGITQILAGILGNAFGLVIAFAEDHSFYDIYIFTPHWTGLLCIIAGSLSVAAARNPRIPLVKGALGMNIVSAVLAGCGVVISSISMVFQRPVGRAFCDYPLNETEAIRACHERYTIPYATMYSTVAFLLVLTILEFLLAIVNAAFGCASICRNVYSETTVVIFQNTGDASAPLPSP